MARTAIIGTLIVFAIFNLLLGLGFYLFLKKRKENGQSLYETPVNQQTRTEKLGLGEILVYLSLIAIAGVFAFQTLNRGGVGNSILAKMILLPVIMALFNARKRTGKSLLALLITFMVFLVGVMFNLTIGLPPQAPILQINESKIILGETKASELMDAGFDIYVRQSDGASDYEELLTDGSFQKYPGDKTVTIEKGFRLDSNAVPYAPYLLAKDGIVLGSISFYGAEDHDVAIEDSKVIQVRFNKDSIEAAKKHSITFKLNELDLTTRLKVPLVQEIFKKHLWSIPPSNTSDVTQLWYGLKWSSNSDSLFWNEYYGLIRLDENYMMTDFELAVQVARDK
ncbi:hypothetical protein KZW96_01375 [Streptococcus halitosis]|uniref:hypothetical protein n=1 Tax=Streptococcus halitosis TaxID=2172545 RepID=UPI0020053437|nr:hypothetical protein [Streptococcus halitosis]MCK6128204.1 hypothetical protein [Streptococcus halitosis]MCK6215207.1 hypothetical protein [Streptococcus halitosis]